MQFCASGCWCRREDSNLHGAINPTRSLAWRAVARSFKIGFHTFDEGLTPITQPPKTPNNQGPLCLHTS